MDAPTDPRRPLDPRSASPAEIEAALASYDELPPESLELLAADPRWGPRLRALRLADAWLADAGPSAPPPAVSRCPSSEELYHYGGGPGAEALPATRRAELDRHVLHCEACRGFARTLSSRPPVPLADGLPASIPAGSLPAPARPAVPRPAPVIELERARRRRRLVPLAAAAALGLAALTALRPPAGTPAELGWPGWPQVRGAQASALVAPRDRVLAAGALPAWAGPAAAAAPRFELVPAEGDDACRVELWRTEGGALDAGELVATLEAPAEGPLVALEGPALAPGRYTWRAWSSRGGIERELGARDFEVTADAALVAELHALAGAAEPARSQAALRLLHERGYLADARALARRQPASPERDAYLSSLPPR